MKLVAKYFDLNKYNLAIEKFIHIFIYIFLKFYKIYSYFIEKIIFKK